MASSKKTLEFQLNFMNFDRILMVFWASWGHSFTFWVSLGASWRDLGASWRDLGVSWRVLARSWRVLAPSWATHVKMNEKMPQQQGKIMQF